MLQRLYENPTKVYLLLGVAAIILGALWLRTRDRRFAYGLGGVAALVLLFFGLNLVRKETDGEQIQRKTREMAAAVRAKDVDAAFQHVSDQFRRGNIDKATLRVFAKNFLTSNELSDFQVSKIERVRFHKEGDTEIGTVTCRLKVITHDNVIPFRVEGDFVRDPDGQWRLKTFRLYLLTSTEEFHVPGLD